MFGHLTLEERREMVNVLESYTSQQEATPQVKQSTSVILGTDSRFACLSARFFFNQVW